MKDKITIIIGIVIICISLIALGWILATMWYQHNPQVCTSYYDKILDIVIQECR